MKINSIYNKDVFDFLNEDVDNESVNLIIADPPYNLKKAYWDTFDSDKSFFDFTYRWIEIAITKLKKNGSLYIFNTPYNNAFIFHFLLSKGLIFQNWITWDKRDGLGSAKRKYSNGQETILFFTKNNKHTFNYNDIRIPYDSIDRINHAKEKGILKNGKRWFPNENGKLCGEVWHFSSERHKTKVNGKIVKSIHLTPKPLDLIERIIKASSNENDLVMDCFMGTGTTAVAAKKNNRNYIGCEIDTIFFDYANDRINKIKI